LLKAFKHKRPMFLWGPPGIGKSELVADIAEEQRLVYLGSMMALNLAHKLVEEQEEVLVNSNGELI